MSVRLIPSSGTLLLAVCWLAMAGVAAAESTATLALQPGAAIAQPEIEVLADDEQGVNLAINLQALALERFEIDGEVYQTLAIEGGQLYGEPGAPALPAFTRYVSIPATAGTALRIGTMEEESYSDFQLLPMQEDDAPTFQRDEAIYSRDAFVGGDAVTMGAPSLLRDQRVVPVTFHPVRYNPATGEVRVARRVELAVEYAGADLRCAKERATIRLTPGFDEIYRSLIVNYDPESYRQSGQIAPHLGTWVLISRNDATVIQKLQPLIAWRQRMGYNVVTVTTSTTGADPNSIRTWLRNAYTTWEDPPEYICIVGDATGSFAIGTFHENWSCYGEGDHPYSMLTGEDLPPDAFIGRLSAEDTTTLERIVNKITGYEQTPYMTDTSWFGRACLTGDPSHSGVTCIQIMQWVKERLRQIGYTQVDTVFAEPYRSRTLACLNQGNTFFGYRGYWGMSSITAGDIASLTNGWKLTYGINLTCGTGSWESGTSINEAWLRGGAGTTNVTGGIGSVATATLCTATRYNNCFFAGGAYGMFWGNNQQLGHSQARGKLEMILNYEGMEYGTAGAYCYWNTLMGDPATTMWTGVPLALNVTYPATVALGANEVEVAVQALATGLPVEGAWVYLSLGEQIRIGGYTDANGVIVLPIDTGNPGTVNVTVTGHNLYAHRGSLQITEAPTFIAPSGYSIDDGADRGNGDGQLSPGETVNLHITLENFGAYPANSVVLQLGCTDPYAGLPTTPQVNYGYIGGYGRVQSPVPIPLSLYPGTPPGHAIHCDLLVTSDAGTWASALEIPTAGPNLLYNSITLSGFGTTIDPGESGQIEVQLRNTGTLAATGPIRAMLASESYSIRVIDAEGAFNTIGPNGTGSNGADRFGIYSPVDCIPGQLASLRLELVCSDGIRLSVPFTVPVGTADSNDPTGPDAYGYYCYDQTDTAYPEAPTYQWIDINPAAGGPGTSLALTNDDSRTLDLPFTFVFYGEPFNRVTVCSNGWLAMGHTYLVNYRNWHLPSSEGPGYMIAGFWDNLYQSGTDREYSWYDQANHRFVVAWDRVRNDYGGGIESFEIILYDPLYRPTITGDGVIEVMYELIQDTDAEQMYSTAGIQNGDHSTGINFCYYRQRPATAANFASGLALRYTTGAPGYTGVNEAPTDAETQLLLRNEPNPWSGATTIRFQLAQPQPVQLRVFDVDGRLVRQLYQGALAAGQHALEWSGAGEGGEPLPAGVYYYRLETPERSDTRPMLLVR